MKTKQTNRRQARSGLQGLFLCGLAVIVLTACSKDEPGGGMDGDLVAVEFKASMDGSALPQGAYGHSETAGNSSRASVGTVAGEYSGITETGVPYRDYTDSDGFVTRAFYPGGASRHTGTAGNSGLADTPQTRTTAGGDEWTGADEVGIFMLSGTGSLTTPGDILESNKKYNAQPGNPASTAGFTPGDGTPIYYPQSGAVDFIAYYPYTGATGTNPGQITTAYKYNLTVAGQEVSQEAQNGLDVFYAKTTAVAKSRTAVNLEFGHVLSKVTLNVTAGDGIDAMDIQNLAATAVGFKGMPVTATMDLQDGSLTAGAAGDFYPLKGTATGTILATFTALVVPQTGTNTGRTVAFTVSGVPDPLTWTIPDTEAFGAGRHYTYPVTVTRHGVTVGMPTINDWNQKDNTDGSGDAEPLPIKVVYIPAGTFLMGSPDGNGGINGMVSEPNRQSDETLHEVTLTRDFYMGKYPVTNAEYAAFLNAREVGYETNLMTSSGGSGNGGKCGWGENDGQVMIMVHSWSVQWDNVSNKWFPASGYERHPVINVTWYGAYEYATWLTQTTGLTCRLPTEAEWEYACRGGQSESLPFGIGTGRSLDGDMANINGRYIYDMNDSGHKDLGSGNGTYLNRTSAVGDYSYPNGFGLYDMHGNVWEWCCDWYAANYGSTNANDPATDPTGPDAGNIRVLRGGSWLNYAQYCRSAFRHLALPDDALSDFGFRVVFVP